MKLLSLIACSWMIAIPTQDQQISQLIKQLDDDDPQVRDEATQKLIKLGKQAIPALQKVLINPPSYEVKARAESIIYEFEQRPARLVREHYAKTRCVCHVSPWHLTDIKHEFIEKYLPDCRFFIADWICDETKPGRSRIAGSSSESENVFEVDKIDHLMPYLIAVKNKEEMLELAGVLTALAGYSGYGSDVPKISAKGQVEEKNGTFAVTVNDHEGSSSLTLEFNEW